MAYESVRALLNACKSDGQPLYAVICKVILAESGLSEDASRAEMRRAVAGYGCHQRWDTVQPTVLASGFAGGDAAKVEAAAAAGASVQRWILCCCDSRST